MKKNLLHREKLLQLMRISLAQIILAGLFAGMGYAHPAFSQKVLLQKLSLNLEDKKLCEVLFLIEKKADVRFSYLPKQIEADRKVSIQAEDESLEKNPRPGVQKNPHPLRSFWRKTNFAE